MLVWWRRKRLISFQFSQSQFLFHFQALQEELHKLKLNISKIKQQVINQQTNIYSYQYFQDYLQKIKNFSSLKMNKQKGLFIQKARQLYKQTQDDVNQNKFNKITEERMRKRYHYMGKQVQRRQKQNQSDNIQEIKFYKSKFKSLTTILQQSMRQSYLKSKFQKQIKDIIRDDYQRKTQTKQKINNVNSNSNQNATNSKVQQSKNDKSDVSNLLNSNKQQVFASQVYKQQNKMQQTKKQNGQQQFQKIQTKLNPQKQHKQSQQKINLGYNKSNKSNNQYQQNQKLTNQQVQKNRNKQQKKLQEGKTLNPIALFFSQKKKKQQHKLNAFKTLMMRDDTTQQKKVLCFSQLGKNTYNNKKQNKKQEKMSIYNRQTQQKMILESEKNKLIYQQKHQQILIKKKQEQQILLLQNQLNYKQKINQQLLKNSANPQQKSLHRNKKQNNSQDNFKSNNLSYIQTYNKQLTATKNVNKQFLVQKRGICSIVQSKEVKYNSKTQISRTQKKYVSKLGYLSDCVVLFQDNHIIVRLQKNNSVKQNPELLYSNDYGFKQKFLISVQNNSFYMSQNIICTINYDFQPKYHSLLAQKSSKMCDSKPKRPLVSKGQYRKISDIILKQKVQIEILSDEGFTQQIIANINVQFFQKHESQIKHTQKSYSIVLPITFIECSSRLFSKKVINNSNMHGRNNIQLRIQVSQFFKNLSCFAKNSDIDFNKVAKLSDRSQQQIQIYCRSWFRKRANSSNQKIFLQELISVKWQKVRTKGFNDKAIVKVRGQQQLVYLFAYILMKNQKVQGENP